AFSSTLARVGTRLRGGLELVGIAHRQAMVLEQAHERVDNARAELRAGTGDDLLHCFGGGSPLAVRSVVRHRIEAIGDGGDRGGLWNLLAFEPARVAAAVPAFVVAARDVSGKVEPMTP